MTRIDLHDPGGAAGEIFAIDPFGTRYNIEAQRKAGDTRFNESGRVAEFRAAHGPSASAMAFRVADPAAAMEWALDNGFVDLMATMEARTALEGTGAPAGHQVQGVVIGMALYYVRYSTWKGQRMYLEDILVTETMRGQKIGSLLFDALIVEAKEKGLELCGWED